MELLAQLCYLPRPPNQHPGSDSPMMVGRQLGPRMVSGSSLLTATLVVGDRRRHCCERRALLLLHRLMLAGLPSVSVCVWRSSTSRLLPRATTPTMVPQPQPTSPHHGTTPQPTRPHKVHSSCSILRYYLNHHYLFTSHVVDVQDQIFYYLEHHHQQDHNCSGCRCYITI